MTTYEAIAGAPPGSRQIPGIATAGAEPTAVMRTAVAAALASATGTSERARYSKSSRPMASNVAATGLPNVALVPAARAGREQRPAPRRRWS